MIKQYFNFLLNQYLDFLFSFARFFETFCLFIVSIFQTHKICTKCGKKHHSKYTVVCFECINEYASDEFRIQMKPITSVKETPSKPPIYKESEDTRLVEL